jgi:hypothetical protein
MRCGGARANPVARHIDGASKSIRNGEPRNRISHFSISSTDSVVAQWLQLDPVRRYGRQRRVARS